MQKLVGYLEQHVQWVALGLGGLYLLAMIYGYVVQPPVQTQIGTAKLIPGDVPGHIVNSPVQRLDEAMNRVSSKAPEMPVEPFADQFVKKMGTVEPAPLEYTGWWINSRAMKELGPTGRTPQERQESPDQLVRELPQLPAARPGASSTGRSVVNVPAASGSQELVARDCHWVTQSFTIPAKELAKAFDAVKLPPGYRTTVFLRLEMLREEQLADGTWSKPVVLKPLSINALMAYPGSNSADQSDYAEWAGQNMPAILQPPFYAMVKPDLWYEPGETNPNVATKTADLAVDAADAKTKEDQRKQQQAAQAEARRNAAEAAKARRGAAGRGGPGAMPPVFGGGGRGRPVVADPDRPVLLAQGFMPPVFGGGPGGPMPAGGARGVPSQPPVYGGPPGMSMPGAPVPPTYTGPTAAFDPAQLSDVRAWAHDDTVQPGKTYRYKLRYKLQNPVFKAGMTDPPTLADQFALESPVDDRAAWSAPVAIASDTLFWLSSGIGPRGDSVRFDVFTWGDGEWRTKGLTVSPGDAIEDTGYVVVDLRTTGSSQDTYALIADDSGSVMRRDYRTDQSDPKYTELKNLTKAPKTAGAPGTPVMPGGPGGGGAPWMPPIFGGAPGR